MNNTVRTDRLDEAIWNRYRTTIESLYWEKSLDKIDAHMKKHHGFVASKSQYERHFRKWELRKNLTTAEWAATIRYLMRNSIDLEQVEVLFKGRGIPQNRVLQEIARRSSFANTLHHGPHRLPKDIGVRRRSCAPTMDTANGLQIIPAPATSSSSMQAELDFGLFTITSPSIHGLSFNKPTRVAEYSLPFSWTHSINFDSISQSLSSSQQLVKWTKPSKMQLDAIFHSKHWPLVDTTYGSHSTTLPMYAIASLANNISSGDRTTSNDAYALLKTLPLGDVSRSLKALPTPILDAIKERVFATAVRVGDVDLVSTMLELDMDPHEQVMMDWPSESKPTYPLQLAVASGHFAVAKTLCMHMCREATHVQLDELIDHVVEGYESNRSHYSRHSAKLSESEKTELMCIALDAGAKPHQNFLGTDDNKVSVTSLKQLVEASEVGIIAWLEAGLLQHYFTKGKHGTHLEAQNSLARDVLQFVLYSQQHYLPRGDPRLRTAILGALHAALRPHNEMAVETILEAFSLLGYHLNDGDPHIGNFGASGSIDRSILEAFDNADWSLVASSMIEHKSMANTDKVGSFVDQESALDDAIGKNDLRLAYHRYTLLNEKRARIRPGPRIVELAISLGDSTFAITFVEQMEDCSRLGVLGLLAMLEGTQISTVSTLLLRNPIWKPALEAASKDDDLCALETLYFHGLEVPYMTSKRFGAVLDQSELQLCFRTVAYHLMAKNDYKLCKWLLKLGMDPDELHASWDHQVYVGKAPGLHCSLPGGIGPLYLVGDIIFTLPSLLAVAAEKSNIAWMRFLMTEGVSVIDSMALLRAIKSRATAATIHLLLDAAKAGISSIGRSVYGVAALRQAVRHRDISRIDILCDVVNIDEIEPFTEEFLKEKAAISPLGEAIIADDSEMVRLLLKRGASPNAYVSFNGLRMSKHIKSHIQRVTPLLAAIDIQSLPLVKILVEHGAELQYTRSMGISRTPLQRAAETGSFDIVEYLTDQDAIIDTVPVYSGGTALQLAALNGFCGIAAFLLEHRADTNYPPAKGDGRTAFEAAAEWGHVDTMSLLMQWNVNLDAQFGELPESQYERARWFAEQNGFMASKRFVEHLYGQRTRDESWPAGLALDSI
ncbi:hypothetical protein BKA58DRAFT_14788 [Alternaria rosae]|uniref:uncharacterized protein n=1 Tax=Alternaria rosae TaxID=1187941 RepID=UPI001E8E7CE7|nr:uncharacterized protein BKA58DRAFT_14788 [Alternaria rosae]KAH6882176.1 hypothetical protein BKA58DRAFT_14788 [Alternaria rosae]